MAAGTGLEFVGWILAPGQYVHRQAVGFWERYIDLVRVREQLDAALEERDSLLMELAAAEEERAEARRLRFLLGFAPPRGWKPQGVRIIAQRLGPNALLETIMLDKGRWQGVTADQPVVSARGIVGRVYKAGPNFSTVLLLTDPNSRIPVIAQDSRIPGILCGQGEKVPLKLLYVPVNAPVREGELLVASGLAGIFPKGIPAARITSIRSSETSLFLEIEATPLEEASQAEELLVISRAAGNAAFELQDGVLGTGGE